MKKNSIIHYLAFMAVISVCAILLASCAHNEQFIGSGKVLKAGPICYVNGLLASTTVRENSETSIVTNDGDATDSAGGTLQGVREIRFRTGPQVTGYLVDLAKLDAEAAKAYVESMSALNAAPCAIALQKPITQADRQQPPPVLADDVTGCPGNGTYIGLSEDKTIVRQQAIVAKLLTFDGSRKFENLDETYAKSLEDLQHILSEYARVGKMESPLAVKHVTVSDGVITDLLYVFCDESGCHDVECPNCTPWELPEMLDTPAEQ